jgi:hypothetical protein
MGGDAAGIVLSKLVTRFVVAIRSCSIAVSCVCHVPVAWAVESVEVASAMMWLLHHHNSISWAHFDSVRREKIVSVWAAMSKMLEKGRLRVQGDMVISSGATM